MPATYPSPPTPPAGRSTALLRLSAALWGAWGLFHFVAAIPLLLALREGVEGIPHRVAMAMGGADMDFFVGPTLMEHAYNNAWFGLVVTAGSVGAWKGRTDAALLCAIVGGMAHLGFTIFLVVPGHADLLGVALTGVAAFGVLSGLAGVRLAAGAAS